MKLLLQHKIVVGYLLMMVIIGCMVAIVLYERNRVQDIEKNRWLFIKPSVISIPYIAMLLYWQLTESLPLRGMKMIV